MILVIDNTKDLENAKMTPHLLAILEEMKCEYKVVSTRDDLFAELPHPYCGVILTGGPLCLSESNYITDLSKNLVVFLEMKVPILGICFGYQVMAAAYGGDLKKMKNKKTGFQDIHYTNHPLFHHQTTKHMSMYQNHHDYLVNVPYGFKCIATDGEGRIQAIAHQTQPLFGTQFHPEYSQKAGQQIIHNFLSICQTFL